MLGIWDYYSSLSRRSTLFDGYQSFAIYSSINQGLDELSYGGRLSRRNSVTESSYQRSSSRAAMTAAAEAAASARQQEEKPMPVKIEVEPQIAIERGRDRDQRLSRQNSDRRAIKDPSASNPQRQSEKEKEPTTGNDKGRPKPRLTRRVSFTEREPVIIQSGSSHAIDAAAAVTAAASETADSSIIEDSKSGDAEEPRKPRRKKERPPSVNGEKKRKSKRDRSGSRPASMMTAMSDRRKSQPLGDELFQQVSSKLIAYEKERKAKEEEIAAAERKAQVEREAAAKAAVAAKAAAAAEAAAAAAAAEAAAQASVLSRRPPERRGGCDRC